jgi:hypothetical protein
LEPVCGQAGQTDTPRGLKPHGFSGSPSDGVSVSIPAAERLKAVPPPMWTLHASPGERGSINAGSSARHLVQGTLLLLPVGTTSHGTGKQHGVGKVQDVLSPILIQAGRTGKGNRLLAHAKKRLTAWGETQRLAVGESPFLPGAQGECMSGTCAKAANKLGPSSSLFMPPVYLPLSIFE